MTVPDEVMPTVTGPSPPPIIVVTPDAIASSHRPAESKWTCTSIAPAVAIIPSAERTSVFAPTTMSRIDAVHRLRVARLADAGDPAVLDPDVALDDPDHGIDHQHVGDHEVERAIRRGDRAVRTQAVAQRLAAAEHALVARHEKVALDLGPQLGVAEPDAVARRRPEQLGVVRP